MARSSSQSSSDGEETRGLHVAQAAPYEIRSAKRIAAIALLVSAVACLCSLGMVINTRSVGETGVVQGVASSAVGLSAQDDLKQMTAQVKGLLAGAHGVQYGLRPVPHHLVAPMTLRTQAASTGAVQRQMPAGVQVFPISVKSGWVQVVVPQQEEVGGVTQNATFGWLPERTDDGADSLVEDTELKHKRYQSGKPVSEAAVRATWDEARAKNKELQAQVAELQRTMAAHNPVFPLADDHGVVAEKRKEQMSLEERRSKGGAAVKAEVSKVVNMNQISKQMHELHTGIAKELKKGKVLSSIGKVLG